MKKRVLVTGGAGFIGSNLCERLLKEGFKVICLDNFFTGSRENINHLCSNPDFEIIEQDVQAPIDVDVEQIYNLACPASPPHYQYNPIETTKTSVLGVLNVLELARRCGATILQASTSEVYGDPLQHPQVESYWGNVNPIGIRSCYDEGKRVAETLMMDYYRRFAIDIRIVRIFNTYGPNMDMNDGRVVSNFIVQALKGEDVTIYGEGLQTRSFCYVDDLIDGLILMMNNQVGFVGPVNLGNPSEFTIKDFANMVINKTSSSSKLVNKELPSDDPCRRRPDINLAKDKLGWEPKIRIEEGLDKTIQYFSKKIKETV